MRRGAHRAPHRAFGRDRAGRDVARNARLFAALCEATDDADIAVFNAKYHYDFRRPQTVILNSDVDGNDATSATSAGSR